MKLFISIFGSNIKKTDGGCTYPVKEIVFIL